MKADEELLKLRCMFALVQNLAGCCRAIERVSEEGRGFFEWNARVLRDSYSQLFQLDGPETLCWLLRVIP